MPEPTDAFDCSFTPHAVAVSLLAKVANDPTNPYQREAAVIVAQWRSALASPEQIAAGITSDELEIDDAGACISEGEGGYFLQSWQWVDAP